MKNLGKIALALGLIVLSIISFTACGANNQSTTKSDAAGRIVVLSPADMEILFAIGAQDKVVGRSNYCDYPEAALSLQSVGECLLPNTEKIVALNPDVIITEQGLTDQKTLDGLTQLGLRVDANLPPTSIEGIYDKIAYLGKLSGSDEAASKLVSDLKDFVIGEQAKNQGVVAKKVYYVIDTGEYGEFAATGDTFINDIIGIAGFDNVAKNATGWMFSPELLITADPEFIIGSELNLSKIKANAQYKNIKAVKENKLIAIDDNIFSRPSPRAIMEGVDILRKLLK
ncbi:MAG: ABC transporter substrate-binding protein [Eubacteriales bacterium]